MSRYASPRPSVVLARHDWPGNVRELRNVIEQAAVLARQSLQQKIRELGLRSGDEE